MPGLSIILNSKDPEQNEADLARMVFAMSEPPSCAKGTYGNKDIGLYVGWVCHKNSYCDCLPLRSEDGNLLLFFYGEHLADEKAERTGAQLRADARAVLSLFEAHGMDALTQLNGWFYGVLADLRRKEIVVFNDRYGMQRLHFCQEGGAMLFASEAKVLLTVRPSLRRLDPKSLADFLSCGCVLENRSLFGGVNTLPAATAWSFKDGTATVPRRYFTPKQWESQPELTAPEFLTALEETLPRAVRRCLGSQPPVGMSLTGGFDTRLIMACLYAEKVRLPSYTFGGMYRDCFDVTIARRVAEICECRHEVFELGNSFLQSFPALAEKTVLLSDGCLGATNAYELYLNQFARQVALVRLTGSYGSEVMRGARAFKAVPPTPGLIHPDFRPQMEAAIHTFNAISPGHPVSFSVFRQAPWYYYNRLAVEQSQVIVRTPYMDNDFVGLFYRRPTNSEDGREMARRFIARRSPALAVLPTDTGNCSYLRHQWSQFLFKADYCYKSGMPQWLEQIHHVMGPLQPEKLLIGRHRFAHFRVWFRRQLAPYIQEILFDSKTAGRPYFNHAFVQKMVRQHIKGERNYTDDIERVLTVELACRLFVDN